MGAQPKQQHLLTPLSISPDRPQAPKGVAPARARLGTALATAVKVVVPGRQTREEGGRRSPACPRLSWRCVAVGMFQARSMSSLSAGSLPSWHPPLLGSRLRPAAEQGPPASHDGAAVAAQRALEAQGGMHVFAAGAANALEQLAEEQQDVPVVLGRALHIAALPGLAHQVRHVPARDHASVLQVSLVAHDDDGRLRGANHPAGRGKNSKPGHC